MATWTSGSPRNMTKSRILGVAGILLGVIAVAALVVPLPSEPPLGSGSGPVVNTASTEDNQFLDPAGAVLARARGTRELKGGFPAYGAEVVPPFAKVYEAPSRNAEVMVELPRQTEHGQPQTLLVLKELLANDRTWLKVLLPVRPNGTTGWVAKEDVKVVGLEWAIDIHLGEKRLDVIHRGQVSKSIPIGIGTRDTPTPGGSFYIMELLQPPNPNTAYGKYTYVLNGYSNVVHQFNGGPGLLGIHGTNDPSTIGKEVSHGCIRMTNSNISELVPMLPLGTPVRIFA